MDLLTRENSKTTTSMERATMSGKMEEPILVIGNSTRCTAKDYSAGKTEEDTKVTITMTRSTDMECSTGKMEENMMAAGSMENNKDKAPIPLQVEKSRKENG